MERKSKVDLMDSVDFNILVKNSNSVTDLLKTIGYKNHSGTMHNKVKKRIKNDGLNTDHMNKLNNNISRNSITKTSLNEILIENSTYTNRTRLKIRLVNEGILKYKCVECENEGEWMDKPISLQLDHKNGVNNDNRLENLRFMCPNCHSQTDTFSGKNQNK